MEVGELWKGGEAAQSREDGEQAVPTSSTCSPG